MRVRVQRPLSVMTNQMAWLGPAAIAWGFQLVRKVIVRPLVGLKRPTMRPLGTVNHRPPSGPAVTPPSGCWTPASACSEIEPSGAIRPSAVGLDMANHRAPSGPVTIDPGVPVAREVAGGEAARVEISRL